MNDFQDRFAKRLEKVKVKTERVFNFEKVDKPPFLVNGAFYHCFGMDPDTIADNYCQDPAVMTSFQQENYYEQMVAVDDDFVPYLMPWFGTGVLASALGAEVDFPDKMDPAVHMQQLAIKDASDIKAMEIADPDKAGLMPKVLETISYMKEHSFLPIGITDCQGPLATANQLIGYDKLIYLMVDDPTAAHELMDKITESLIVWIRRQKQEIGESQNECFGDQQIYTGRHSGVWVSDDDAVLMDPKTYREFVVPYNSKIFQAFGGGILHYCGTATHQIDNFLNTQGLVGINVYCLHDLDGLAELKKRIQGRLVLIACDFTPANYQGYYRRLLETLSYDGLIIDSQFSPIACMTEDGKYSLQRRDKVSTRRKVFDFIKNDLLSGVA
jgi:uroporphyrinogen-III decarboxylase